MGRRLEYEVKTSVRLNMSNPQHVKINDVIQNLDPKIFKSKNQFIIDAIQFYIDNYGKETFVIKKKEKERAEYIRSEDIDDIKEEVIEAATNEAKRGCFLAFRFCRIQKNRESCKAATCSSGIAEADRGEKAICPTGTGRRQFLSYFLSEPGERNQQSSHRSVFKRRTDL